MFLDVDLLSVLLKLAVQGDHHIFPESLFIENLHAMPREELRGIKTRMAHLLLDAGARPQAEDAAQAAFFGDWYLTTRILAVVSDINSQTWKATLLEAAILSCDLDTTKKAFELYPDQYSAGALCAAALVATRNGGDFGFLEALLNNRLGYVASGKQESYQEMAAIGISAYSGNWELLQLLKRKLPWSQLAIVPTYNIGPRINSEIGFGPLKLPDHYSGGFWYGCSLGSVQMFAAQAEERIFSLFVNQEFPLTAQCVVALILGDKAKHNRIWTWIQTGHRIHKGDDYLETDNPLRYAIFEHDISLVRACLELGANIDGYPTNSILDTDTALAMAIHLGQSDIAGLLIDKGASVNLGSNYKGNTPLFVASGVGQLGVVRMLLSIGANPNEPTNTPPSFVVTARTPLEAAAKAGRLDITHLLLVNGVNTEGEGRLQYVRAISFASKGCHIQVRRRLESHRLWTKEDETLLNDPKLFDSEDDSYIEDDSYTESSSSEYHSDNSKDVSEENMPGLTPLANDPEDTILDLESENAIEAGAENISQQLTFGSSPGFSGILGDPFLGTGDDMSGVRVWEDLDSYI
ncbi:Ankyrin repeat domain-containing protein 50 [Apiospora kogelbergensis]|uniref:Ankyrin repeat domain-containing protein 50 n=1 Tax=Apiospora kogelbergensis TaxID=1337665 RepID=A0AAW0RDZ7_9PEZI